jgi:hypothetical protein
MDKSSPGAHATTSICESVLSHDSELSPSTQSTEKRVRSKFYFQCKIVLRG